MGKIFIRSIPVVGTLWILLTILTACEQHQSPIRLGTNVWTGYEPLYLARDIGLLNEQKVRLVAYPSASEVIRAFRNRSLEAASLTLDEALLLVDKDVPIKIILVHDVSHGADVILARPGIGKVSELSGRTIAVESGALGAYAITRALQKNDLDVEEVRIRHLDVNQHEAAYQAGEIDAAVSFEPFSIRLIDMGARIIFSSRDIPGEIVDVLVVHEDVHATRLPDLRHLTQSWFEALSYLETEPRKAAAIMGRRLKISNDEVLASYEGMQLPTRRQNVAMLQGEKAELQPTLEKLASIMRQHDLISRDLELQDILSSSAVD